MQFDILSGKFTINDARGLNPLVLAFIGDSVYETFIRAYLIDNNRYMSAHKLHLKAISFVKAHSQSEFMRILKDNLNEEEYTIFKRGRNAKSGSVPKNADVREYRMATGFEALIGFLYITEQVNRLNEILNMVIDIRKNES